MANLIVKLAEDRYAVWSNTVDAPVSPVLSRLDCVSELHTEWGISAEEADGLLSFADEHGTTDPAYRLDDLLRTNRAGPDETRLTLDELLVQYSRGSGS